MKLTRKIAAYTVAALAFTSCSGLAEAIDNIKDQAQELISQINVDPESLQKLMGNASRGMKIAGNRMGANFQASGVGGGESTPPPDAPAAPSFRAFAEDTTDFIEDCANISATQGDDGTITVIEGFEGCTGKKGQVKSTMSFGDAQINFKLDFTEFSEGAVGTDDYSYVDGSMSWQASRLYDDAGIVMLSNNGYTTRFSDDTTITVAETIALEFIHDKDSGGALTIKGTSTASDGVSSATLFFDDVVFDPQECPRGPSEGEIILSQNDKYVKITISGCGEAVQITKNSTGEVSVDLTAAQLEAFFQDFVANVGAFFEIINGTVSRGVAAIDNGQEMDDCSTDPANLLGSVVPELENYLGNWCAAWPADPNQSGSGDYAWIECVRICSKPNTVAPDIFRFSGIATIPGGTTVNSNSNYFDGPVDLTCRDEFPYGKGAVNYVATAQGVSYFNNYNADPGAYQPQGGSYTAVDYMWEEGYSDPLLLSPDGNSFTQYFREEGYNFVNVDIDGNDTFNGHYTGGLSEGYYVSQSAVYPGGRFFEVTGSVPVCTYEDYEARDAAMGVDR